MIGDAFTNLGDFFPFVNSSPRKVMVWTNHKQFKLLNPSGRFQGSPRILV